MAMIDVQGRAVAVTGVPSGTGMQIGEGSAERDDNERLHAAFIGGDDRRSPVLQVGLLGCGTIGRLIAAHANGFEVAALYDQTPEQARELAGRCGGRAYDSFAPFADSDIDLVVEAASPAAVRAHGEAVLRAGKDLVVMSVGALADAAFLARLREAAIASGRRVRIPSGAVMGLDNLKIGRIGGIDRVVLRTTKNPASLGLQLPERTLIFKGRAEECIKAYPKNINVSAAIALAAGQEIEVELWADPVVDRNVHEICAEGPFGDACLRVRNVPSPDNPATSYLAALSILALLHDLGEPIVVGT